MSDLTLKNYNNNEKKKKKSRFISTTLSFFHSILSFDLFRKKYGGGYAVYLDNKT